MAVSMKQGIEAFLSLEFGEPERPYRTQRDARDEAMRQVGYAQAQEELRNILGQCRAGVAQELAEVRTDGQLKPLKIGPLGNAWVPPEFPVKAR